METTVIKGSEIAKMKYVVQCYISDKKGMVVRISDYSPEQLEMAYQTACEWYGDILPCPDNGRYEDYVR